MLLACATSTWIWVIRPRQLVEAHDSTGRITVRVPRAWTSQVEGRVPQQWSAYLYFGEFERTPLKVSVYDGIGHLDLPLGRQCGVAAEELATNAPGSRIRLWAFRNCPEGRVTVMMEKIVENRISVIAQVRADDERSARNLLADVDVKLP